MAVTSSPSISSLLLSARPTSEPSKYKAHVPAVTLPSEVGVNASTSSSARLASPEIEGLPLVETSNRPSESSVSESIVSLLDSSPTSLPSKYRLNVPAVRLPSEVASKRRISCGAAVIPLTVTLELKDIRIVSASTMENAKRSGLPTPTSEPSKKRLQPVPLKCRMSSSANATPPTVPLPVNDR